MLASATRLSSVFTTRACLFLCMVRAAQQKAAGRLSELTADLREDAGGQKGPWSLTTSGRGMGSGCSPRALLTPQGLGTPGTGPGFLRPELRYSVSLSWPGSLPARWLHPPCGALLRVWGHSGGQRARLSQDLGRHFRPCLSLMSSAGGPHCRRRTLSPHPSLPLSFLTQSYM